MVIFGLFGLAGFPLYYVIWKFVFPQPYENLGLRLLCMGIALPALLIRRWPKSARRYIPLYWYLGSLVFAPFFFTFMLLGNGVNTVWSGSLIVAIFLVVFLYDFLAAIVLLALGTSAAFLAYAIFGSSPIPWAPFGEQFPVYIFTVATAGTFNLQVARERRAKISAAMAFGGHIAHELRTPLAAIRAAADFMDSQLCGTDSNCWSDDRSLAPGTFRDDDFALLRQTPGTIVREVDHAFMVIDLALANTGVRPYGAAELSTVEIIPAVTAAISRYPFKYEWQRDWVHIDASRCFKARIVPVLFDHLIFNLLKNAAYAIEAAGRTNTGRIVVRAEPGRHFNFLHISDNGLGIAPTVVAQVFNPFFSTRVNGTGLGLHYCLTVMTRFGGEIKCRSTPQEHTEITLAFPTAVPSHSTTH